MGTPLLVRSRPGATLPEKGDNYEKPWSRWPKRVASGTNFVSVALCT
jgi:hypothetical protein